MGGFAARVQKVRPAGGGLVQRVQRGRRRPSGAEYKGERGKGRGFAAGCGLLAQAGCVEGLWKSSQVVHAFGVRVEAAPFGRGI